jgi:hypothetical protein
VSLLLLRTEHGLDPLVDRDGSFPATRLLLIRRRPACNTMRDANRMQFCNNTVAGTDL